MPEKKYSVKEAEEVIGASRKTVLRWIDRLAIPRGDGVCMLTKEQLMQVKMAIEKLSKAKGEKKPAKAKTAATKAPAKKTAKVPAKKAEPCKCEKEVSVKKMTDAQKRKLFLEIFNSCNLDAKGKLLVSLTR